MTFRNRNLDFSRQAPETTLTYFCFNLPQKYRQESKFFENRTYNLIAGSFVLNLRVRLCNFGSFDSMGNLEVLEPSIPPEFIALVTVFGGRDGSFLLGDQVVRSGDWDMV